MFIGMNAHATAVEFTLDTSHYTLQSGHIRLEWASSLDTIYELQQSNDAEFVQPLTIYRGPDKASFISGLANGMYYYRVRAGAGEWSAILTVDVQHQSLTLAFSLFGLGGIVFLLTVLVVVRGARNVEEEPPE